MPADRRTVGTPSPGPGQASASEGGGGSENVAAAAVDTRRVVVEILKFFDFIERIVLTVDRLSK